MKRKHKVKQEKKEEDIAELTTAMLITSKFVEEKGVIFLSSQVTVSQKL
jgi:hypothetical protein